MELSIIVPVYNTEIEKLKRCCESVKNISGVKYECLLVDDGSESFIGNFCVSYAKENSTFKYFRKENGGVSSARNFGIKKSCGKYIAFVDSDDEVRSDNIAQYLIEDYTLIFSNITVQYDRKNILWKAYEKGSSLIVAEDVLHQMSTIGTVNGPVGKFISRTFLLENNIEFDESMVSGEDAVFLLKMLQNFPQMYYIDHNTYLYHKELETGKTRLLSKTLVCINDNIKMYRCMTSTIDKVIVRADTRKTLYIQASERFINQLFNISGTLLRTRNFNGEKKQALLNALEYLDNRQKASWKKKTKLQYAILDHRQWKILTLITRIRDLYRKVKTII